MDPVAILLAHVGYHEQGVNCNIFSHDLGHPCEAWCGDTVTDCYKRSGHRLPPMQPGLDTGFASVYFGFTWAQRNGLVIPSWEADRNDAVCFGWEGEGIRGNPDQMHVALVVSSGPKGTMLRYVGGNQHDQVSVQEIEVGSNLIMGCINLSQFLKGDVHHDPAPGPSSSPRPKPRPNNGVDLAIGHWDNNWPVFMVKTPLMRHHAVSEYQQRMIDRGWHHVPSGTPYSVHAGRKLGVDNIYGPDTAAVTWAFQEDKGIMRDGKLGPVTWLAASRTDNVT